MRKLISTAIGSILLATATTSLALETGISSQSAPYEANWDSLDQRSTPEWWSDAKFGIFIHWGVYSVPAFGMPGEYAEWYWDRVGRPIYPGMSDSYRAMYEGTKAFHNQIYGEDFSYFEFAPMFDASFFDADEWADMFADSGARYVVMVSKHHDGFALWPSAEASNTWKRPWNSADIGPKRDLLGELTEAVREKDLHMGIYYSLYEWFNPIYDRQNVTPYVNKHMVPQFKDVVTRYKPEVIFSDGEWDVTSDAWQSEELLAWLFNDSPVKDSVVVNDRWGKDTRHNHGGYYTTEYGAGLPNADHPWEENRGMGHSYGFNRAEALEDYATNQQTLLTLIDTVSRGGNLLLNVGPTADGRIPVIMQERLAYLGNWLKYNGEAIYGTRTYKDGVQWTDGELPFMDTETSYRAKYDVLSLLVSPEEGQARKEVLFTRKGDTVYAMTAVYPAETLTVKDVNPTRQTKVTLLGADGKALPTRRHDGDLIIKTPDLAPGQLPFDGAWVFKIEGLAD